MSMLILIWSIWFQKQLCTKDLGLTGFRGGSRWWVLCWCDSHSTMMWTSVSGWELSSIKLCHCYAFVLFLHWRLSSPASVSQRLFHPSSLSFVLHLQHFHSPCTAFILWYISHTPHCSVELTSVLTDYLLCVLNSGSSRTGKREPLTTFIRLFRVFSV